MIVTKSKTMSAVWKIAPLVFFICWLFNLTRIGLTVTSTTMVSAFEYVLSNNHTGQASSTTPTPTPYTVVLYPNERLERGKYHYSPSQKYRVGFSDFGNLVLEDLHLGFPVIIWSSHIQQQTSTSICKLQTDGNLVIRDTSRDNKKALWRSKTGRYAGTEFIIDDHGQIALLYDSYRLWVAGVPKDYYNTTPSEDLIFPIRATFYYPWYPETFTVNGKRSHYKPSLGWYSSSDPKVAHAHIDSMNYAYIQLSIASWWGPDRHLDRARISMLMDTTVAMNSTLKWTIYYEQEMKGNLSVTEIEDDLNYLMMWFAKHEAWGYIDGKPIIFVYNDRGCDVPERWMKASQGKWYVVLKVFKDFDECPIQPDSWHQYGSGDDGVVRNRGYSFVISAGFWRAGSDKPRVPRLSSTTYCENVRDMTKSGDPWQLVLSFNEAGEGTMIESSDSWASQTKYGQYLDCLHGIVPIAAGSSWRLGLSRVALIGATIYTIIF